MRSFRKIETRSQTPFVAFSKEEQRLTPTKECANSCAPLQRPQTEPWALGGMLQMLDAPMFDALFILVEGLAAGRTYEEALTRANAALAFTGQVLPDVRKEAVSCG